MPAGPGTRSELPEVLHVKEMRRGRRRPQLRGITDPLVGDLIITGSLKAHDLIEKPEIIPYETGLCSGNTSGYI